MNEEEIKRKKWHAQFGASRCLHSRVKNFLYFCIKQNTNNKECNQNKSTITISGRYVVIQKNKELSNNCTTIAHIMNSFTYLVTGELDERG